MLSPSHVIPVRVVVWTLLLLVALIAAGAIARAEGEASHIQPIRTAKERLGVLWATHLMDEVARTDLVVILHKGVVLYNGPVPQLLTLTGTSSVREAFRSVTGTKSTIEEAA